MESQSRKYTIKLNETSSAGQLIWPALNMYFKVVLAVAIASIHILFYALKLFHYTYTMFSVFVRKCYFADIGKLNKCTEM